MSDDLAIIEENRDTLENLSGKDLPASDLANALLEISEESE